MPEFEQHNDSSFRGRDLRHFEDRRESDRLLKEVRIEIERKTFDLALKENSRGRFLRIRESKNGRSNTVIIPAAGFRQFQETLGDIIAEAYKR